MKLFDIHLSASKIGDKSVSDLLVLGFVIDHFRNCRNSTPPSFHATYRGPRTLPDETLWRAVTDLLKADPKFSGIIEEEECGRIHRFGPSGRADAPRKLPALKIGLCPPSQHKACDVHIRLALDGGNRLDTLLATMGTASFDRDRDGRAYRVYTATFPTFDAGSRFCDALQTLLPLADCDGQLKLEATRRFLRQPADAVTLPITSEADLHAWLDAFARVPETV